MDGTSFVLVKSSHDVSDVGDTKCVTHVLGDEPRLTGTGKAGTL